MAEHKLLGIIVAVGLVVVAGIFMLIDWSKETPDEPLDATVAVTPPDSETPSAQPQPEQYDGPISKTPLSGKVVVAKRPVEVLSSPSASASAMFGFPAGRPFRVIGGAAGYVKIQDLRSGASGWIEEAALKPAPPPAPAATERAGRTSTKPTAKASRTKKKKRSSSDSATAAAEPKPEVKRERPRPFGGLFGGLFGGR